MPLLVNLGLHQNHITDAGFATIRAALDKGALDRLETFGLGTGPNEPLEPTRTAHPDAALLPDRTPACGVRAKPTL